MSPGPRRIAAWPFRPGLGRAAADCWGALIGPVRPPLAGRSRLSAPWHEDGQVWRALLITYPDTIVAHHCQRTYYLDGAGLPRRLDYSVDILGVGPSVHYSSAYREFDGIMVPTRRRVYVRSPEGSSVRDSVSIAVDVTDVTFG